VTEDDRNSMQVFVIKTWRYISIQLSSIAVTSNVITLRWFSHKVGKKYLC
jgi:hypothetical protein